MSSGPSVSGASVSNVESNSASWDDQARLCEVRGGLADSTLSAQQATRVTSGGPTDLIAGQALLRRSQAFRVQMPKMGDGVSADG